MILNKNYYKIFNFWLVSLLISVSVMITIGGITRLTGSGLSITEWEMFKGILPPLTNTDWDSYFLSYKQIPQYKLVNSNMTLSEFKIIFYWEYIHRILGRFIGLLFIIPFVFFLSKKIISSQYIFKLWFIFLLILLQGFIGWYMVSSGLVNNVSVSHYRLALHLCFAFIILGSLLWIYMNFVKRTNSNFLDISNKNLLIKIFIFLLFCQIIMGAFVSGLDAGNLYQTWPLMNDSYFPDDVKLIKYFDIFDFKNHSLVQFFHRNLAYIIFLLSILIGYKIFKYKKKHLYKSFNYFFSIILIQVLLGILTLLSGLNIYLALAHQFSSILLLISTFNLYHYSIK